MLLGKRRPASTYDHQRSDPTPTEHGDAPPVVHGGESTQRLPVDVGLDSVLRWSLAR